MSYQEIIAALQPNLIIEFGTHAGGSALYFADLLRSLAIDGEVITFDISMKSVSDLAKGRNMIRFIKDSSISPAVRCKKRRCGDRVRPLQSLTAITLEIMFRRAGDAA